MSLLPSLLSAILLSVCLESRAPAAQEPITTADLLSIRQVVSLDIAPDGSFAIYGLKQIHPDDPTAREFEYRTHLWSIDLNKEGAEAVQLTHGARTDSSPQISPDGRWLAFVRRGATSSIAADEPGGGKPQVWLLSLEKAGEARALTRLEHGASQPRWRPDSRALLVTSALPESELDGQPAWDSELAAREFGDADPHSELEPPRPDGSLRAIRNWLALNSEDGNPRRIHRLAFQGELGLKSEARYRHLFEVDLDSQQEPQRLTEGFRNHRSARYSPDGQRIVFVDRARGTRHPDRVRREVIYEWSRDGGVRALLDEAEFSCSSPRYDSSGDRLYFTASRQIDGIYRWSRLASVTSGRREMRWHGRDWKSGIGGFAFLSKDKLAFSSRWQGDVPLLALEVSSDRWEALTASDQDVLAFDVGGGVVVAALATPTNPCELYRIAGADRPAVPLTRHNQPWLDEKELSQPHEHWIERPDGTAVQYWVMEPTRRREGSRYPVVLEIHGGPAAMWGPATFSMWHEFQLLCSWGYGVVYANPRGSGGYGHDFQRANYQDWGTGPSGDVLACLEDALDRHGWMDAERLCVTGGSYAGYLTAWIVGHDQRFRAAVAQRGVYELSTFYGEGNAFVLVEGAFGGYPWEPRAQSILRRESPFTYVDRIRTPLLILHASQDLRTGVSQSEMLYRGLKQLQRPVEYVRYPGAGHDLSRTGKPLQRMDRLNRILEFFARYADNERRPPQTTTGDGHDAASE